MRREMTLKRFAALAEAYGADLGRWPEGERFHAAALAARAPEARTLLERAGRLDAALDLAPPPPVASPALKAAISRLADGGGLAEAGGDARRLWAAMPAWLAARAPGLGRGLVFAAATVAGLVCGIVLVPQSPASGGLALIEAGIVVGEAPTVEAGELMAEQMQ